jgi:hypothetical protein
VAKEWPVDLGHRADQPPALLAIVNPQVAVPELELVQVHLHAINPFAYLADVIPRVQGHPKRRLDELLPGPWARARASA